MSDVVYLAPEEIPKKWYNILPDLPEPLPEPRDPEGEESRIDLLPKIFLKTALKQEFSKRRWIRIPDEVLEMYMHIYRPRPLVRARRLEKFLKTPARLYYKREDLSPTGSHKVNTAIAQAYYAAEEGYSRLTTETGAGQWGSALSLGASLMGLEATVYMVRFAYNWKPGRRTLMKLYGAECLPSPSDRTEFGRKLLKKDPNHPGSLGIAVSEGIEDALKNEDAVYCLGSVLNHVLLHQTVIGLEVLRQLEEIEEVPDFMISCLGGGSNFGGFAIPAIRKRLKGEWDTRFIAAQSMAAPNLVKGEYKYDFGDAAGFTPLLKMYTLGHDVEMPTIYAEGLRYHAAAPIISLLRKHRIVEAVAYETDEKEVFEAAKLFVSKEGFVPAPESSYSIKAAIDKAIEAKEKDEEWVIVFNVSGHGFVDLEAFNKVLFSNGT